MGSLVTRRPPVERASPPAQVRRTELTLTPLELIDRLAALAPPSLPRRPGAECAHATSIVLVAISGVTRHKTRHQFLERLHGSSALG